MIDKSQATLDVEKVHQLENEIHSLQIVDFIFSNIEGSKGISSVKFDSVLLKKNLHHLLQLLRSGGNEAEISELELQLRERIEDGILLLAQRDKKISVSELRLYCERSKPPISPQALLSLIRFYIGLPFSELIRAKLDMLLTRLFSHESWNGTRQLTASRGEIKNRLEEFYRSCANVPSFSQFSQKEIDLVLNRLHEFSLLAEQARSLDELLRGDFHSEFLAFKSGLNENFFEPSVLAGIVEANILIGNRYVELLLKEKEEFGEDALTSKYAFLDTEVISTTVGKTFSPLEIVVAEKPNEVNEEVKSEINKDIQSKKEVQIEKKKSKSIFELSFEVKNKWLVVLLLLTIILGSALYAYVELSRSGVNNTNVEVFDIENTEFKEYLKVAKISNQVMFGVVTDKWNNLSEAERRTIVDRMLDVGRQRGFDKVYLLNNNGLAVASASGNNIEVFDR